MKRLISFVAPLLSMALVSGCNPAPSPECVKYLKCTEAVTPGSAAALKASYDTGGSCWASTTVAADSCTTACKAAVATLASGAGSDKAECK